MEHTKLTSAIARRLRGERGSFLVEAVVTAALVVTIAAGTFSALDGASRASGDAKQRSVAASIAQAEIEYLRSLPLSDLYTLDRDVAADAPNSDYDISSSAQFVDDAAAATPCAAPGSTPSILRVSTTVTPPTGRAVTLRTFITPPARAFRPNQGALSVALQNRDGDPVSGIPVRLTGGPQPVDATTNAQGCVVFGFLATGAYQLVVSQPGYTTPDGMSSVNTPVNVLDGRAYEYTYEYDQAGSLTVDFETYRPSTGSVEATQPNRVSLGHAKLAAPRVETIPQTTPAPFTIPSLFPFATGYSVYAGSCASALPPTSAARTTPLPEQPAQPKYALIPRGGVLGSPTPERVRIPALDVRTQWGSGTGSGVPAVTNEVLIKVTTACANVYTRGVNASGWIADAGFPYGTNFTVCAEANLTPHGVTSSGGRRYKTITVSNTSFDGTTRRIDFSDSSGRQTGTCP